MTVFCIHRCNLLLRLRGLPGFACIGGRPEQTKHSPHNGQFVTLEGNKYLPVCFVACVASEVIHFCLFITLRRNQAVVYASMHSDINLHLVFGSMAANSHQTMQRDERSESLHCIDVIDANEGRYCGGTVLHFEAFTTCCIRFDSLCSYLHFCAAPS